MLVLWFEPAEVCPGFTVFLLSSRAYEDFHGLYGAVTQTTTVILLASTHEPARLSAGLPGKGAHR